jgi:glyoxylase-like metal-dependent hydrolase (beta-lactamase superfamily II)
MTTLNRREFVASLAGVSALGLTGSLAVLPSTVSAAVRDKGFYSYKVGQDAEVISIYDGVWQKPHDENFITGVSVDETKKALQNAGLDDSAIPIEFAFTIVKTGGKTILIDAGTGGQLAPTAGLAPAGMEAAGIAPADIDTVIISHFHPDHIFGLMEKETNAQVFPNANILVGETEYKFWTDPGLIERLPENRRGLAKRIQATFPTWKNVSQFSGGEELISGITAVDTFGHTAGHSAFRVSSGDDQVMLIGDVMNLPALFLANLDWQMVFDADKDAATATRKALVEEVVADGIRVAGYHFGFPNSGMIVKDGGGHVFTADEA